MGYSISDHKLVSLSQLPSEGNPPSLATLVLEDDGGLLLILCLLLLVLGANRLPSVGHLWPGSRAASYRLLVWLGKKTVNERGLCHSLPAYLMIHTSQPEPTPYLVEPGPRPRGNFFFLFLPACFSLKNDFLSLTSTFPGEPANHVPP